jgi:hypothetical protein
MFSWIVCEKPYDALIAEYLVIQQPIAEKALTYMNSRPKRRSFPKKNTSHPHLFFIHKNSSL